MINLQKIDADSAFSLLLAGLISWGIYVSTGWPFGARLLPQIVGVLALVIIAIRVGSRVVVGSRSDDDRKIMDLQTLSDIPPEELLQRTRDIAFWVVGFVGIGIVLGLEFAIPLFLFPYLVLRGGLRIWTAAITNAVVLGILVGIFDWWLGIRIPAGLIWGGA